MPEFDILEDTMFVPMLGRIYTSINYPNILYDKKALELKNKLPKNIKGQRTQTEYTLLAGAVRSMNMDRYIQDFIKRNKDGIIVNIGAGLETTYYRNDNGYNRWFEVDLQNVIKYRLELLGETNLDKYIIADAFNHEWIDKIRKIDDKVPILVIASGLFFYFPKEKVLNLLRMLSNYGNIEVVFDVFNKLGISCAKRYMKQVGHEKALMYFYVNNINELAKEVNAKDIEEERYYKFVDKNKLKFSTKITMIIADLFNMIKMIHLKLN